MIAANPTLSRWVPWLFALLFAVGVAYVGTRVQVTTDMAAFLPRADDLRAQLLLHELRSGIGGRLLMIGIEGETPARRADSNRALTARLRASGHFSFVNNGDGLARDERERLFRHRYLLSPTVTPARFSADALAHALRSQLDLLASSAGLVTKQWLARDPTGEFQQVLQAWRTGADGPVHADGVFANADGSRSLMLALVAAPAFAVDAHAAALAEVRAAFAAIDANHTARLVIGGAPAFAVSAQEGIRRDVVRLSALATGAMVVFLFLALRSVRAVMLSALPLSFGILAGVCAVALGFGSVHGITIAFGSTLIGVAVDYPLHFLGHLTRASASAAQSPYAQLARIWPTLRLGAFTTVIAFAALMFSRHTGLAQLGVFAVAGIAAAAATTRWLLPALIPRDFRLTPAHGFVHAGFARFAHTAPRAAKPALLAALAAAIAIGINAQRLWAQDLAALSPAAPAVKAADAALRADFAVDDGPLLLAVGASAEAVLHASEQSLPALAAMVARGALTGFDAPARWLPSVATQRARQAALPTDDALHARLAQALRTLPFRPAAFAPFVADIAHARTQAPLTPSDFAAARGLVDARIAASVFPLNDRWIAATRVRGARDAAAVHAAVERAAPSATWLTLAPKRDATAAMHDYRDRALRLWALGALGIFATLVWGLRSFKRALAVFVSPLAATATTVAILLLGGVALTLFHVIGLLLVMGLGIDYALYFDRLGQHADEWETTYPALWKAWLTTLLGFSMLLWSQAPVLTALGLSVTLGISLSFFFAAAWARGARRHV